MIEVRAEDDRFEELVKSISFFAGWLFQKWGWEDRELEISLRNTEDMTALNQAWLNHDYDTDVISRDLSSGPIQAYEIHLGVDCIEENARIESIRLNEELRRCVIHGLLHIKGLNDATSEERSLMRSNEEYWLKLFHVEHHGE